MFKTIKPALFALCCLAIVSCKKDIVEENALPTEGNIKNSSVDPNINSSYYPNANGSDYTYVDTTDAGSSTSAKSATAILGDTTIDGKIFSKTSSGSTSNFNYLNSNAGVTTLVSFNGEDKITSTVLKANEPVGTVWTDNFSNAGVPGKYEWKMIAKGITRTVLGVTFKDVIQVHMTGTATVPAQGKVVFADADYFYAPNTGLIESITYNTVTGKTELHRVLQSRNKP